MENTQIYFSQVEEWSNWLSVNYESTEHVWLVFYKKHSKRPTLTYEEALEEALCFGWVDSLIRKIDEDCYERKFTQRTNLHNWSKSNQQRVEKLIEEGRMTEIGLNKIGDYSKTGKLVWPEVPERIDEFSDEMLTMLQADLQAWDFFSGLSSSHKQNYIHWIMEAKREETKIRRMQKAIEMIKNNQKSLM